MTKAMTKGTAKENKQSGRKARKGSSRQIIMIYILAVLLVISAVSVIYTVHRNRDLFAHLRKLKQQRDQLEIEWGRLLLEKSSWASQDRIEKIAQQKLNMRMPEKKHIVVVRP